MSKYKMNIRGKISPEDCSVIYDYISIAGEKDDLTVEIDEKEEENKEIIYKMLKNKKFNIVSDEVYSGKRRYIRASRYRN
ncbi:hypothetical protein [uncultured Clostridium sp.]|uniref:hypothetical protein n=1 Tax=uncultured Clostridium sp. TaxID=59620 RepID=UPI0025E44121|nr:hypothetical protein [uncultured Clostridium sp.]NLU07707.1 hypothetical protein [Clostridiales bacterium]